MTRRGEVIAAVAAAVPAPHGWPVRVAIDGMTGTGKTTFIQELADALRALGVKVTTASGDDFHHQREVRYRQGRHSARGYLEDAYHYGAMADKLLAPLAPGGSREVRLRHHDLVSDAILDDEPVVTLDGDAVLLVEGSFLQRPEVAPHWDFVIVLEATKEASALRQVTRDGAPADPEDPYHARYFGAYDIYVEEMSPRDRADVIVENTDLTAPVLLRGA